MRYSFEATSVVTKRMLRLLVYQVTLPYRNFVNKTLILSTFLWLRYSRIGAKMGLLKNIIIDLFVILLACINFAHLYSTLFLNGSRLSALPGISATSAIASLTPTGSPT